ncbi:u31-Liphistoxin-Lth1a_1, partial [Nephila pilipes]
LASVRCPKLEHDDLIIRYRRGQTVGSEALLSCKQRHKVLVGRDRLRCLPRGQWSSHIRSRCEDVPGCIPPLKSTDSKLFIEPNKQFYRYGEMVLLSCPVGTILSSEVVRIFCQRTGWSQKDLPECIDR